MALSDYELKASPFYGASQSEQNVTHLYRVPVLSGATNWYDNVPTYGASDTDAKLDTIYFKSWAKHSDDNDGDYVYLDLTYTTELNAATTIIHKADGTSVYLPTAGVFEKPIEAHADYQTRWNNNLYQHNDYSSATPSWWGDTPATDQRDADGTQWLWAKESPGDSWVKQEDKTKPGKEAFYLPTIVVRYMYWHATKATVETQLQTVATRETPGEVFGYSTGEWLVTSVQIDEDGTKYRGTVEYTWAEDWDDDFYGS